MRDNGFDIHAVLSSETIDKVSEIVINLLLELVANCLILSLNAPFRT